MIALPARREPAPLVTRPVGARTHASVASAAASRDARVLDARIDATVDAALAQALAKVKTPADDELAKQQQAFDQLMLRRTEDEREANALREFGMAQAKKEDEFLQAYIRMI